MAFITTAVLFLLAAILIVFFLLVQYWCFLLFRMNINSPSVSKWICYQSAALSIVFKTLFSHKTMPVNFFCRVVMLLKAKQIRQILAKQL